MVTVPYYETSNFCFSNFSAHTVEFGGIKYSTVEHAYHAQKFTDTLLIDQIRDCGSPLEAWELSRQLKPRVREGWDSVKVDILTEIIRSKADQHQEVRDALLATGTEEIIEINPNDSFWGNGPDGNGQNNTGKILMKVREELSNSK